MCVTTPSVGEALLCFAGFAIRCLHIHPLSQLELGFSSDLRAALPSPCTVCAGAISAPDSAHLSCTLFSVPAHFCLLSAPAVPLCSHQHIPHPSPPGSPCLLPQHPGSVAYCRVKGGWVCSFLLFPRPHSGSACTSRLPLAGSAPFCWQPQCLLALGLSHPFSPPSAFCSLLPALLLISSLFPLPLGCHLGLFTLQCTNPFLNATPSPATSLLCSFPTALG